MKRRKKQQRTVSYAQVAMIAKRVEELHDRLDSISTMISLCFANTWKEMRENSKT